MSRQPDFRSFVEGFSRDDFYYAHDTEGVFYYLSPSIEAVLGYTPDEFQTHYSTYLTDDPVNLEVEKHTALSIQGVEQPRYQVSIRHKDGSTRWLEVKERPVKDASGAVVAVEGHARDITDWKASEKALREVRAAVEQAGDALAIADLDGVITFANPAWARLHGYEPDELIGVPLSRFHSEEQLKRDVEPFNAVVRKEGRHEGLVGHLHRDGREFPTWMSTVLFRDRQGRPAGLVGLARDMSAEQARTRRGLLARAVLSRLNSSGDLGDMLLDTASTIRASGLVDDAAFLLGGPSGPGLLWTGPGEDPGKGMSARADIPLRSDAEAVGSLLLFSRSSAGFPSHILDFFEGLGASIAIAIRRNRAESALKRREERYRDLVENLEEMVLTVEVDGNIGFVNGSSLRVLGCAPASLIGRPLAEVVHPAYREALAGSLCVPAAKLRCAFLSADGTAIPVEADCRRVSSSSGAGVTRIIARDLRMKDLLQEQTSRVERLRALSVLAGGVAHDFNNYLTAILGCIGLSQESTGLPADVPELLAGAERAALKARGLAQQLLFFSKGSAPDKRPLDLGAAARESAVLALSGSPVLLEADLKGLSLNAEADPSQMGQVFANLAINAREAMPDGGVLRIDGELLRLGPDEGRTRGLAPGPYVHLRFQDSGAGIGPDILEKIYDPFFTTKSSGSGMGLAVCHTVVSKHDGALWAESALGKGSVFHILLPATDKAPAPDESGSSLIVHGSGRVLVMDDEPAVLSSVCAILKAAGYQVDAAKSGEEAVAAFSQALGTPDSFGLVLLDLVVKGAMGGMGAATAIRAQDPAVRLLAMSGYSEEGTPGSLAEHGFNAFLAKPFRPHALTALVADSLARG